MGNEGKQEILLFFKKSLNSDVKKMYDWGDFAKVRACIFSILYIREVNISVDCDAIIFLAFHHPPPKPDSAYLESGFFMRI